MRLRATWSTWRLLAASTAMLVASCSAFHGKNQEGGETHFLKGCTEGACPSGLECICGVCTASCESNDACGSLGQSAGCRDMEPASALCESTQPPSGQVCDAPCTSNAQCATLGEGYQCVARRCRAEGVATEVIEEHACSDCEGDPLVMIVLDTSGSMENITDCECTTARCEECMPKCSAETPEKNRWTELLEALVGTFETFMCEAVPRDEASAYDFGYSVPYHAPQGVQRSDGLFREYGDRLRFGLATFDGIQSYDKAPQLGLEEFSFTKSAGQAGLWSYPAIESAEQLEARWDGFQAGVYRYPGCPQPFVMNTGIRGPDAESGALVVMERPGLSEPALSALEANMLNVRPYGSTPIAAALDDVRWLFERDPMLSEERAHPERPRHLILITDGSPDDDYRSAGCACFEDGDSSDCSLGSLEAPLDMHCPYPTVTEAARRLRCGSDDDCDAGPFDAVHIVGLSLDSDELAVSALQDMAAASAGSLAFARDGDELRNALSELLDAILDGSYQDDIGTPGPSELQADGTCEIGPLIYENGASWQDGCNRCECQSGNVSCTTAECTSCTQNSDCESDQRCWFGVSCASGLCGPETIESCSEPVNASTFCTCDGSTLAREDCSALMLGVEHAGGCEP